MSHFTVMVIGEDPEKQLAPYQENNMGDCPEEFLSFNDHTDEVLKDWAEADDETIDKYGNVEKYAEEYHGYKKDPETGKYGYWVNKNAKWDWYQLGGRWTGFFKVKEGANFFLTGKSGLLTPPAEKGYADAIRKKDIDFESMRREAEEKAGNLYDKVISITGPIERTQEKEWDYIREKMFPGKIDEARAYYHNLPEVKALQAYNVENNYELFGIELEEFMCTREEYCKNAGDAAFVTFALLKDGVWYERGEMGWFGMAHNEKDPKEWNSLVASMVENLPDETLISVYDCHI